MGDVLTIEDYLRGMVPADLPERALASIFAKRGIEAGTAAGTLDEKLRDLSLADVYVYVSAMPSVRNNTEDSDGGWKHTEGGYQMTVSDKRALRALARRLLEKWGERLPIGTIVIKSW